MFEWWWKEAITRAFLNTIYLTACPCPCWPGGQTGATGPGWFPHQTGSGLFGESHTVCRPASCRWHDRCWTDGFGSGGQVWPRVVMKISLVKKWAADCFAAFDWLFLFEPKQSHTFESNSGYFSYQIKENVLRHHMRRGEGQVFIKIRPDSGWEDKAYIYIHSSWYVQTLW